MDIYNRCKWIPCKQCWRGSECVTDTKTTSPHVGEENQLFPSKNSNLSCTPRKRCHRRAPSPRVCSGTACAGAIPRDWECHGLTLLSVKFYISSRGSWKASLLQPSLKKPKWDSCSSCGSHPNTGSRLKNGNRGKMSCTRQCTNHSFSEQDTKIHLFVSLWNNLKYSSHNIYFYNPVIVWAYRIFKPCQKSYLDWILKEREKSIAAVNDDIFQWAEI